MASVVKYAVEDGQRWHIQLTNADHPYTVPSDVAVHYEIYGDTDNMPAGVSGRRTIRITNVGTSSNDITADGATAETVRGALTQGISDGETLNMVYDDTQGWW